MNFGSRFSLQLTARPSKENNSLVLTYLDLDATNCIMKLSGVCLSLLSLAVVPAAPIVISPDSGGCWSSTLAIITAEIVSYQL
jgi:hypothetical protein